jgi:hypothetical protein
MKKDSSTSFRIVCDINGEFRVEVLDKTINHWYIVVSRLGQGEVGFEKAVEWCMKYIDKDETDSKNNGK